MSREAWEVRFSELAHKAAAHELECRRTREFMKRSYMAKHKVEKWDAAQATSIAVSEAVVDILMGDS